MKEIHPGLHCKSNILKFTVKFPCRRQYSQEKPAMKCAEDPEWYFLALLRRREAMKRVRQMLENDPTWEGWVMVSRLLIAQHSEAFSRTGTFPLKGILSFTSQKETHDNPFQGCLVPLSMPGHTKCVVSGLPQPRSMFLSWLALGVPGTLDSYSNWLSKGLTQQSELVTSRCSQPIRRQRLLPFAAPARKEQQANLVLLNQDTSIMDSNKKEPSKGTASNRRSHDSKQEKKKQLADQRSFISTYQKDFVQGQIPQHLVLRNQRLQQAKREPKRVPPTTYQQTFCDPFKSSQEGDKKESENETDKKECHSIPLETLVNNAIENAANKKVILKRYSVAECLRWPTSLK
ncbi:uncharacterized protein LOC100681759 [Ornithorhynchus anatinus]|uniref:uncharacterized protein LOC100681759 n=1 Tax=Ornithorhynchus anatinus TaxID=9258 RepID=UPI00022400D5|nr:uncharacterized protein LOC100681759 [Ornithorhynchus anatinus]